MEEIGNDVPTNSTRGKKPYTLVHPQLAPSAWGRVLNSIIAKACKRRVRTPRCDHANSALPIAAQPCTRAHVHTLYQRKVNLPVPRSHHSDNYPHPTPMMGTPILFTSSNPHTGTRGDHSCSSHAAFTRQKPTKQKHLEPRINQMCNDCRGNTLEKMHAAVGAYRLH